MNQRDKDYYHDNIERYTFQDEVEEEKALEIAQEEE